MCEDAAKRVVTARVVKVLRHHRDDRGMVLEAFASRCVRQGEVHELVTTDQAQVGPGTRIDRVGFLGFAEMTCGGVVEAGDVVCVEGRVVGRVIGFDACHYPNHYNIIVGSEVAQSGLDLGLEPENSVAFNPRDESGGEHAD